MKRINLCILFCALANFVLFAHKTNTQRVLVPFVNEVTNYWGFKDSVTNEVVVPLTYTDVYMFSEGLAAVNLGATHFYNSDDTY